MHLSYAIAVFSDREHSSDGGRHWQALNLARARPITGTSSSPEPGYSLPGIFPGLILAPVVVPYGAQQNLLEPIGAEQELLVYADRTTSPPPSASDP